MDKCIRNIWNVNLEATNINFRMNLAMNKYIQGLDKEFSLLTNYFKGKGEVFKILMQEKHPSTSILSVSHKNRNR